MTVLDIIKKFQEAITAGELDPNSFPDIFVGDELFPVDYIDFDDEGSAVIHVTEE